MAMMISKFHRLIQSRILWGAFLVIIVFSFVIWGMVWPSDIEKAEQANAAGLLDGELVSPGEFRSAYLSTYLARALALGRDVPSTPETDAALRRLSWQRLATLREAAKLGITATEDELVSAIRGNFADTNGVYSRAYYQSFVQNMLQPMGYAVEHFEQHVREEIVIQKMGSLIGRQAQVTPLEIRRTFDTLLDEFTVEYAIVRPADVEAQVTVSDDDARKLYDADPAAFTIPEQREVSYVAFPVAAYLDEQAEIPEDDLLDYYEARIDRYTTTETDTNGQPRQVVADFADVREEITREIRRQAALEKADDAATDLVSRAIPGRDGVVPDFAAEAEKSGRPVQTCAPFARFEVPVEDAGALFAATAFDLVPNAYERVSAPITGQENVYVVNLVREHPARVPEFDEIRDGARQEARRQAVQAALAAQATAVQTAAREGLAAGKSFADAVAAAGARAETAEPFTGLTGSSSSNEIVQVLVQAVVSYNQGEVTEPVPADDGQIVAYLKARVPADPSTYDTYQAEIASAIRNRRGQGLFRDWQAGLLAPERFTDLQTPAAPAADAEADEDGPADEDAAADEAM